MEGGGRREKLGRRREEGGSKECSKKMLFKSKLSARPPADPQVQIAPLHKMINCCPQERRQTAAAWSGTKVNKSSRNSLQSAGGRQGGRS